MMLGCQCPAGPRERGELAGAEDIVEEAVQPGTWQLLDRGTGTPSGNGAS